MAGTIGGDANPKTGIGEPNQAPDANGAGFITGERVFFFLLSNLLLKDLVQFLCLIQYHKMAAILNYRVACNKARW